jgi:hypothetical protein
MQLSTGKKTPHLDVFHGKFKLCLEKVTESQNCWNQDRKFFACWLKNPDPYKKNSDLDPENLKLKNPTKSGSSSRTLPVMVPSYRLRYSNYPYFAPGGLLLDSNLHFLLRFRVVNRILKNSAKSNVNFESVRVPTGTYCFYHGIGYLLSMVSTRQSHFPLASCARARSFWTATFLSEYLSIRASGTHSSQF